MRLWHYKLIPHLPRQQLLGQHRECCALRGNGWGKNHSIVNYVFKHPYGMLFNYHEIIIKEMSKRGYLVNSDLKYKNYRGKSLGFEESCFTYGYYEQNYEEHNEQYLQECLENLRNKGITINV